MEMMLQSVWLGCGDGEWIIIPESSDKWIRP